ncbi:MAG: hypothetical protein R3F11_22875 [Verrucomicrobiales bacterium]
MIADNGQQIYVGGHELAAAIAADWPASREFVQSLTAERMEEILPLTGGSDRGQFTQIIGKALANADPAEAVAFADRLPAEASDRVLPEIVSQWAESDPGAAARWAVGSGNEVHAHQALLRWTRIDPAAAAAWAESLPAGPTRDRIRASVETGIGYLSGSDGIIRSNAAP